jgi:hypothetical protein
LKDTKKYDESRQLHKKGFLRENKVELKGNVEVHSISPMSEEGRNNVNEYGNDLLEQDRVVQQAISQVLIPIYEKNFQIIVMGLGL